MKGKNFALSQLFEKHLQARPYHTALGINLEAPVFLEPREFYNFLDRSQSRLTPQRSWYELG